MVLLRTYFFRLFSLLAWFWQAKTRYDVHSPFLAEFCEKVLEDRRHFYAFDRAEQLRQYWIDKRKIVQLGDFGAASRASKSKHRDTTHLAKHSSVQPAFGRLLFRLCQWLKPNVVVELGTNLGIGTCYLAKGADQASIYSIEGNIALWPIIQDSIQFCNNPEVELYQGLFNEQLPILLSQISKIDLLYLDGDHRGVAVKANLKACIDHLQAGACIVIDDIHWSKDMYQAWQSIRQWPQFQASVDLYQFGLLFVQPDIKEPVHLSLVPWKWKVWRMGFFST